MEYLFSEFDMDDFIEIYGKNEEEAILNHAIDQQYERDSCVLIKNENNKCDLYHIHVIKYSKNYKIRKIQLDHVDIIAK